MNMPPMMKSLSDIGLAMANREVPQMKLFLVQYRSKYVRLFRRNIIDKTVQDIHTSRIHQVKAGIVGQADVYGYVKSGNKVVNSDGRITYTEHAIPLEIEFKAAGGKLSAEQLHWEEWCKQWGIVHTRMVAQATETDLQLILRWTSELNKLVDSLL
jgi:hypothetical protein